MRDRIARRLLAWAVLVGVACMLPRSIAYSLGQLRLIRMLWGKSVETRGELAADENQNPLSYAGAVHTRRKVDKARSAGLLPDSPLPRTRRWARETGKELSPSDRVFMNTPNFPVYVYSNFFFYPTPVYIESAGQSIFDHATMKAHGRYLPNQQLPLLRAMGFTHALIAPRPGSVRLVELPPVPRP